jgi:uncharacterized iron-regulated membrane protein
LYAFQQEIINITEDFRYVKEQQLPFLPPSTIAAIAQKQLPSKTIHAIKYNTKSEAAEAIFFHYQPTYYYISYINPYTGKVLKTVDGESGFFHFILDGHFYLWLPDQIGQVVVASATLIFVFLLISGFILWYPKNKNARKQRFSFKWKKNMKWKRKNYDLHNVTGFYVLLIAFVFSITGLVWGFQWFAKSYYFLLGGSKSIDYIEPQSLQTKSVTSRPASVIDAVWHKMLVLYPQAESIEVHPPEGPASAIEANANSDNSLYSTIDYRYFDQYSLKEIDAVSIYGKINDNTIADTVYKMNYEIHTGGILGLAGKIFAFLISLLIASLPVTGTIIYFGRRKKNKLL